MQSAWPGISALITIVVTYYAYQWGIGHKKQPHIVIVVLVMALTLVTTIPAYLIGRSNKETN